MDCAERFDVKIHAYANVGNHIHLAVQVRHRRDLQSFMRVFAQRVMFQVTGACKGNPQGRFFDTIAYTRAVKWGREFQILKRYIWKNTMEALGFDRSGLRLWQAIPDS